MDLMKKMEENQNSKSQLFDKIDNILQIQAQKFQSEKEIVASYRELHLGIIRAVRSRIFPSVGTIATALLAVLAFGNIQNDLYLRNVLYLILAIDLVVAAGVYMFFVYHLHYANKAWFAIEDVYNKVILNTYEYRIFLVDKSLSIRVTNIEQLSTTLSSYFRIIFDIYRIKIDDARRDALCSLSSILFVGRIWTTQSYTTNILRDTLRNREEFINTVYKEYQKNKDEFEIKKYFLPGWPHIIDEFINRYPNLNKKS